jgi:hypothetical protein
MPSNGTNHVENLEKHRFSDAGVEFANIKGGRGRRSYRSWRGRVIGSSSLELSDLGDDLGRNLGLDDRWGRHSMIRGLFYDY